MNHGQHTPGREYIRLLGIDVTPRTLGILRDEITSALVARKRLILAAHNLHSTYIYHSNAEFRDFYDRADIILIDGMPLVALGRLGGLRIATSSRLGSTDWIPSIVPAANRVAVVGGSRQSNDGAIKTLQTCAPGTNFLGLPGHPWSANARDAAVNALRAFSPDLILVGMGMPLQESVADHLSEKTDPCVIATVGGAIDQISGVQSLAPRWLGRLGLEWLWRLGSDPRRLGHRYLIEPWKLVALLISRRAQ